MFFTFFMYSRSHARYISNCETPFLIKLNNINETKYKTRVHILGTWSHDLWRFPRHKEKIANETGVPNIDQYVQLKGTNMKKINHRFLTCSFWVRITDLIFSDVCSQILYCCIIKLITPPPHDRISFYKYTTKYKCCCYGKPQKKVIFLMAGPLIGGRRLLFLFIFCYLKIIDILLKTSSKCNVGKVVVF